MAAPAWLHRIRADRGDPQSTCPYLRGTGSRVCNQGCWEEPSCHTDAPGGYPDGGWSRYPIALRATSVRIRTMARAR